MGEGFLITFLLLKACFKNFSATCLVESKNLLKNLKPSGWKKVVQNFKPNSLKQKNCWKILNPAVENKKVVQNFKSCGWKKKKCFKILNPVVKTQKVVQNLKPGGWKQKNA